MSVFLKHKVIAARFVIVATLVAPHQPGGDVGHPQHNGQGRGKVFAVAVLDFEQKVFQWSLRNGQVLQRVFEILFPQEMKESLDRYSAKGTPSPAWIKGTKRFDDAVTDLIYVDPDLDTDDE